jgi:hypothetical protein
VTKWIFGFIQALLAAFICLSAAGQEPKPIPVANNLVVESKDKEDPQIEIRYIQFEKPPVPIITAWPVIPEARARVQWLSGTITLTDASGKVYSTNLVGPIRDSEDKVDAIIPQDVPADKLQIVKIEVRISECRYRALGDIQVYNGLLAKDRPCYRDLQRALRLDGVAERRALAELFTLGCVENVDDDTEVKDRKSVPGYPDALMVSLAGGKEGVIPKRGIRRTEGLSDWTYKGPGLGIWTLAAAQMATPPSEVR